ncbi:M16 family metallopeptidase [Oerskovia sp. NPDC057915]|uniref:M16 family metallopeptidase n=1 Tax=Oerskovia sp. NPDC057915 TaxID=3346280 RepID=UPI0036DA32CE
MSAQIDTAAQHPSDAAVPAGLDELAPVAHLISSTTVDGIPVLYAPRSTEQDGTRTAGLFFRVGSADETLATSGITHLVEHLALHGRQLSDGHHNGVTAESYTLFHVQGSDDDVVAYLNNVCAALQDLPVQRLEVEKQILRTEAQRRAGGPFRPMRQWRYGARTYGLAGYDELGARRLGEDDVRAWVRTHFTRDNAVLFVTGGTLPDGLDLSLPSGARMPTPSPSDALPRTPAFFRGEDGNVVLDAVVERSAAAVVLAQVAARALFHDLREEGGYSYTADADYSRRDASHATLTLYADALPQQQGAVVGGMIDTVARLRLGTIEQSELDSARAQLLKRFDAPDLASELLPTYALDVLLRHPVKAPEVTRAELEAVTVEDLRRVATEVWSDALLQVPGRAGAEWAGLAVAPQWSETAVEGIRYPRVDDPDVALVVGLAGVSLTTPDGAVTVLFEECQLLSKRPDGARYLIGEDGFHVVVEPTLHVGLGAPAVAQGIDARVPEHLVVTLPARDPQDVPQPRPAPPAPPKERSRLGRWVDQRLDQSVKTLNQVFLIVAALGVLVTLRAEPQGSALVAVLGAWALLQGAVGLAWWLVARRRRRARAAGRR